MKTVYNGEKDKRAFKSVIPEVMDAMMREDDKVIWLDADLMNCSGTIKGKEDRYVNCGIAEANMAGIGGGLASTGMKPYMHSFGCFASRRMFDQVFMSCGYAGNAVTVVGTDPGVTAAFNGGTHMPFEDMALFRAVPEAIIYDITDVPMLVDALQSAKDQDCVTYIRVPRKESYQIYEDGTKFTPGKAAVIRDGKDGVIVASGIMVREALEAADALSSEGLDIAVIDPVTVKPLDAGTIREYVTRTGLLVTAENHNRVGGLTSAVQDAVCGLPCRFGCVAVEDCYGEVGPLEYLKERFGLTAAHIADTVKKLASAK